MKAAHRRSAAISIDVDALRHYYALHGLSLPKGSDACLNEGLPRFLELCADVGVRATLFVVGDDLSDPGFARAVARAAVQGHEVQSHSFAHDYALSRRSALDIDSDLRRSCDALQAITGVRPVGFRAPGYNLSEALLDGLERAGFAWDSSIMPSPAYFALRAGAIARHSLARRTSSSLLGDVRAFFAPDRPYEPARGAHFRPARSAMERRALLEVPITTAGGLPWIGTTLAWLADDAGDALTELALARRAPVVLELHALDFIDGRSLPADMSQPDARVPLKDKLRRLRRTLALIGARRRLCTVGELASRELTGSF